MDIIFKGRRTSIPERFRQHAAGKLVKIGKLDQKAMRIDVEIIKERNPRQSGRRERVELTIRSRGPVIRAEAAADDRYTALDLAYAKLENRLRRACERRKERHADRQTVRVGPPALAGTAAASADQAGAAMPGAPGTGGAAGPGETAAEAAAGAPPDGRQAADGRVPSPIGTMEPPGEPATEDPDSDESAAAHLVPIQMEGDGPLVVREKMHTAAPMTIDQALLEMELVGHDFYLFHDRDCDLFSVVYRRRGYDYGVIRLVEKPA